jgi:hypothetical protein
MGIVEIDSTKGSCLITANIITYGNAADPVVTERIRKEIEDMWNEPAAIVTISNLQLRVQFKITAELKPSITPEEIFSDVDPRNNFFRIEEFVHGNISFVDGLNSNSGYFLLENLYEGSTTAAHEFGHTLGLDHPKYLDIRGKGVPGIMYPRGTLVDPQYQYDPQQRAGLKGGTLHPQYRRVLKEDILNLQLHRLHYQNNKAVIGAFTNVYHWNHAEMGE